MTMLRVAAQNSDLHWSVVPSPNTSAQHLLGTACITASDCWAVGNYVSADHLYANGISQTLIEHWNGSSWSITTSANTSKDDANFLKEVTCNSSSDCWAVGWALRVSDMGEYVTLIEHWNGTAWSIVASPSPGTTRNRLWGVTCNSAADCWAVGDFFNSGPTQSLIEHWDGTAWSVVTAGNGILYGVSCASSEDCWAVGTAGNSPGIVTVTQHWNGVSWSVVSSPNATTTASNVLKRVKCSAASNCWAVGWYESAQVDQNGDPIEQTLIERWNGTTWLIVGSPNTSTTDRNLLYDVTCTSTANCWAAGFTYGPSFTPIALRWNGTSWSSTALPGAGTHFRSADSLYAISCISVQCLAVGESDSHHTLGELWDGRSWSDVNSQDAEGGGADDEFAGVACSSTADCWAVGSDSYNEPFIGHWDGATWSLFAGPITRLASTNGLADVACTSTSNCWAIGNYYQNETTLQTLIYHWDGSAWSIVSSPNGYQNNFLVKIACASASDCWAIGEGGNAGTGITQTLAEHWNGNAWTIVSSPNPTPQSHLTGVACNSANDCWAVGHTGDTLDDNGQPLVMHWNGNTWAIVPAPTAGHESFLQHVACSSAAQCWAVGYSLDPNYAEQPLIEKWDGNDWSIVAISGLPNGDSLLNDVTCTSSSNCSAVGNTGENTMTSSSATAMTAHWDGNSWTIIPCDQAPSYVQGLNAVTCPSNALCWAVGSYYVGSGGNPTVMQTLIDRLTLPRVTITSIKRGADGHCILSGQASLPNSTVTITSSASLQTQFTNPRMVNTNETGAFQFDDATTGAASMQFYRISIP